MSKKVVDPVEEPEVDEEGEESDDYDDIEEEEEAGGDVEDEEEDEEGDDAEPAQDTSLTAMLLGNGAQDGDEDAEDEDEDEDDDDDDDDDDDLYNPTIKGPATAAIGSAPTPSIGTKRSRDVEDVDGAEDLSGDHGEAEENGEIVTKKARAEAAEEV